MTQPKESSSSTRTRTTGRYDDGTGNPDGLTRTEHHDLLLTDVLTISERISDRLPWSWLKELVTLSALLLSLTVLRCSVLISTIYNSPDSVKRTPVLASYWTRMYRRVSSWLR